jgi:DNA adenine methylase
MSFPLCRWVGGKGWAVERFGHSILEHLERRGGLFYEPFFGGGAMGLHIGSRYPKQIVVSDIVEPLINFYQQLKTNHVELAKTVALIGIEYGLDEKAYYAVRDEKPDDPLFRAAQFLYLNALNFQGLYRENKSGVYNVPAGSRAKEGKAKLPERKAFDLASKALALADIRCGDFEAVIDLAGDRDFLYVDPPYYDTFTDYSKGGFGKEDQERLAMALYRAHERGATFIAHNSLSGSVEEEVGVAYWYEWPRSSRSTSPAGSRPTATETPRSAAS